MAQLMEATLRNKEKQGKEQGKHWLDEMERKKMLSSW